MKKKILIVLALVLVVGLCFFWYLRTKPGLPSSTTLPSPTPAPLLLLQFSLIGDPESHLENLKKAVEISRKDGCTLTVILGDLTHVGSKKELLEVKETLDQTGFRYYVVPGNHDVYSSRKLEKDPLKYLVEYFSKPYQSLLINKVNLLMIDNSDEQAGIDENQWHFIKQNLTINRAKFTFVLTHEPLYHSTSLFLMGYDKALVSRQKDELLEMAKTASVSALFAGHLHHTSFSEKDGLKFYNVGAVNFARNLQTPRFLEVKAFSNGEFVVSEIEL